MKALVVLIAVACTGCAASAVLVKDGRTYPISYDRSSRIMSVSIDGETYTGGVVRNASFGIANSFGGGRIATATAVGTNNQARATLLSTSNKVLRCDLNLTMSSAQGLCQDSAGALYDVVAK